MLIELFQLSFRKIPYSLSEYKKNKISAEYSSPWTSLIGK